MHRTPIAAVLAMAAAGCAGSSTSSSTTPSPVSPSTAAISVGAVAATLEIGATGVIYHAGFQVRETGGQTGATLQSVIFIFRNGYTSGSTIAPLPAGTHVATGGTSAVAPIAIPDSSGNVATEISATVSFVDDSGHKGSASGVGPLPVVMFDLNGVVRDSSNGQPLAGTTIVVGSGPNGGRSTTADAAGSYRFAGLQAGSLTVRAQEDGYTSATTTVALLRNMQSDFSLDPAPPPASASTTRVQRRGARR
jgi:carboxypeptidase family protein